MPRTTPLGVTYLRNETLWNIDRPVFEVERNHIWAPTGRIRRSGDIDFYEWRVIPAGSGMGGFGAMGFIGDVKQAAGALAFLAVGWWLLRKKR